jgi:uncharacterized protein (DUF885 family)
MRVRRSLTLASLATIATLVACAPLAPPPVALIPLAPCPTIATPAPPAPIAAPLPASAPDTPAEHALAQLFADAWEDTLRESPVFASTTGDHRYGDRWPEVTEAAFARRRAHAQDFLTRVRGIARADLSPPSQLNRDLFERNYALDVERAQFGFEYLAIDQRNGLQSAGDASLELRFETLKDYEDWLRRIDTFPEYVDQTIGVLRVGVKKHIVHPRAAMDRLPSQVDRQIVSAPEQSAFWYPFAHFPASISDADRDRLTKAARRAITARVVPAYRALNAFLTKEYLPACFDHVGIWQLPRGDEAYAFLARYHTTTTMTPAEIFALGEREVARIHGEMQATMDKVGFKGTMKDFFTFLRTDPRFFYKDPNALLDGYRAIAKRMDPLLVKLFKTLPRTPYGVEPVPASVAPDTTAAYYNEAARDGSRAGTLYVNLYKPEARPKWEMTALTLHEGVPGHHLQIALQQEHADVPEFRRETDYTVFTEGWGLYAESLGDEVGMYDDPYAKFGQLAYEMWRAIRLVVDTGMHAMKWDRQRAIDYFLDNDPKAPLDVTNEIDRYVVMPGQALAYKIGELKIKELREQATLELGAQFDVREFHDAVLEEGALPLDVLEEHVKTWIATKMTARH